MPFRNEPIPANTLPELAITLPYKPSLSLTFSLIEYGVSQKDSLFFVRIRRILKHDDGSTLSDQVVKLVEENEDGVLQIEFETIIVDGLPVENIISTNVLQAATTDVQDFVGEVPTVTWQQYALNKIVALFNQYISTLDGGLG